MYDVNTSDETWSKMAEGRNYEQLRAITSNYEQLRAITSTYAGDSLFIWKHYVKRIKIVQY